MLGGPASTVRFAKRLRAEMSLPEVLLWRELKKRPDNLKFRRQHAAGPYVLDFFCHSAALAVEIDGEAHNCGDRPMRDEERDEWLGNQGVFVLRLTARDVLDNLEGSITLIVETARQRSSP